MFLNKHSNGYYYIHYNDECGRRISISTKCKTKNEANRFLSNFNTEIADRKNPNISFEKLIQQYISFSLSNHEKSNTTRVHFVVNRFKESYNFSSLNQISPSMLEEYKTYRLRSVKPVTVNIEFRTLKAIFSKAVDWGFLDKNPMKKVNRLKFRNHIHYF